jgi:hypothetical protein
MVTKVILSKETSKKDSPETSKKDNPDTLEKGPKRVADYA